jgi:hypothetical protein
MLLLKEFLQPARGRVRLASDSHVIDITQSIPLQVHFEDNDTNIVHSAVVHFYVLEDCVNDMVIGLPAILTVFGPLFISMITSAILSSSTIATDLHKPSTSSFSFLLADDTVYPWSEPLTAEAPEDFNTPVSVQLHRRSPLYGNVPRRCSR